MRRSLTYACVLAAAVAIPAGAQDDRAARFMDNCRRNDRDRDRFCETRTVDLAASRALAVDGRVNGGITVHGWDRNTVHVLAMIEGQSGSDREAQNIARQVTIHAAAGEVRADGPDTGHNESWSVSYEIWVPRHTDLRLTASNGGIAVDAVDARLDLETVNGGLRLADVDGEVHGRTVNGGITADLHGDRWQGNGLDLRTSNGGVRMSIPANYSANLETGTVNGSLQVDFPVTVRGSITRELSTQLGAGGAPIRLTTTNGGVSIRRR